MKKTTWMILVAIFGLSLAGCSSASGSNSIIKTVTNKEHKLEEKSESKKEVHLFQDARSFSDGVAWVRYDEVWHLINDKGEVQFSLDKNEMPSTNFVNGAAVIDKSIMINKEGDVIFNIKDHGIDQILVGTDKDGNNLGTNSRGYVFVKKEMKTVDGEKTHIGLVNNEGHFDIEPAADITHTRYSGDGQFMIAYEDNSWVIYNSDNKSYYEIKDEQKLLDRLKFNDNYAIDLYGGKGQATLFDEYGNQKTLDTGNSDNIKTDLIGMYSNDRFFMRTVTEDDQVKAGFYDKTGAMITDLSNESFVHEPYPYYSEGYALLRLDSGDSYVILDKDGNRLFEPKQGNTEKSMISNGLLNVVNEDGSVSFVNMDGTEQLKIEPKDYKTISDDEKDALDVNVFVNNHVRVKTENRAFFLNKEGETLTVDFS